MHFACFYLLTEKSWKKLRESFSLFIFFTPPNTWDRENLETWFLWWAEEKITCWKKCKNMWRNFSWILKLFWKLLFIFFSYASFFKCNYERCWEFLLLLHIVIAEMKTRKVNIIILFQRRNESWWRCFFSYDENSWGYEKWKLSFSNVKTNKENKNKKNYKTILLNYECAYNLKIC